MRDSIVNFINEYLEKGGNQPPVMRLSMRNPPFPQLQFGSVYATHAIILWHDENKFDAELPVGEAVDRFLKLSKVGK